MRKIPRKKKRLCLLPLVGRLDEGPGQALVAYLGTKRVSFEYLFEEQPCPTAYAFQPGTPEALKGIALDIQPQNSAHRPT